uniref:F-box domain-containing protein n=1 Tax=Aegilops tauschii subsp. strangulata TaxID=200361 RepID=A0A453Q5N8_AEGTS
MSRSLRRRPAARPSIKALSSYNRWSPLANLAEEEDQSDRLSSLPDGVLLDIVDRLDIADAARTRTLARRWKQIPTMLSRIFITVGSLDNEHKRELTCDDVARANATVLGATRSVLESRTTSLCTINLLCLQFFLGDGTVSIGQIVANTMVTEKVGSAELTLFTMKDTDRCTNDDVLTYGKQFKSFLDACPNAFSGLARLKLENFRLGESPGFPEIFSICKRLEFLRLFNCDMGMLSLLEVSHPLLRELEIVRCYFERVDLKWLPKLTVLTFSLWVSEHDPLSLDYVPLLQTLSITHMARLRHKVLKLSEFLGKATISHLNLNFLCEKIWVKPEEPNQLWQVFHKLRHVTLTHISEECDLNWTMFILQGAPSLQELCIKVCGTIYVK